MTRWRMTDEVKEVLDIVQQRDRKAVKKKVPAKKPAAKAKPATRERSPSHHSSLQPSTPSYSRTFSSSRNQAPPHLSDSDVSSSSDAEIVQQKREAGEITDRIRTSMLQYFGGKKNHTRWVMKCTSRVPEPPPHRSIKKIAIAAYENKSIDFFFALLAKWE